MTAEDGVHHFVVLQRKSQLFPAVVAATCQLSSLPVWRNREPVDPSPAAEAIDDAILQLAFFCDEQLNATLDQLRAAVHTRVETVRQIHASSRPDFGGRVGQGFHADDESGRRQLDHAVRAFVDAARADLRVFGTRVPLQPADSFGANCSTATCSESSIGRAT